VPASLPIKSALIHSRAILLVGFGGLLALMAYAGIDAVRNLAGIRTSNESIQREFLARNKVLNRIRSDLYLSGTYLRDYILEPDPATAERHHSSLEKTRREMDNLLTQYATLIGDRERAPLTNLNRELAAYWRTADPALGWSPGERRDRGYAFLRDEVLPRRANMLAIADNIDAVNEQQLTEGGERVSLLFAGFRYRLTITIGVTLGLGFLLAAFSFYRVLRLEDQAAERFEEIAKAREELKELSARIVETQENERRSLSRELHDEVGQTLSALMVGLSNLNASLPKAPGGELRNDLDSLRRLAADSVNVVRNISLALRPSMLDDLGLLPALQWQAREVSRQTGMCVSVAVEETLEELPEAHKTCIYRVVQEALRNCARHAGALNVRVTVARAGSSLNVSVQDDGRGFDATGEKGLGLLGMQERVASLGGEFRVSSEPGSGALVLIRLPLPDPPATHKPINHEKDEPQNTYSSRG
jgi:signal transduction histidine kinase